MTVTQSVTAGFCWSMTPDHRQPADGSRGGHHTARRGAPYCASIGRTGPARPDSRSQPRSLCPSRCRGSPIRRPARRRRPPWRRISPGHGVRRSCRRCSRTATSLPRWRPARVASPWSCPGPQVGAEGARRDQPSGSRRRSREASVGSALPAPRQDADQRASSGLAAVSGRASSGSPPNAHHAGWTRNVSTASRRANSAAATASGRFQRPCESVR